MKRFFPHRAILTPPILLLSRWVGHNTPRSEFNSDHFISFLNCQIVFWSNQIAIWKKFLLFSLEHRYTTETENCSEELRCFPRVKKRTHISTSSKLSSLLNIPTFTSQPHGETHRRQDQVIWRWNKGWQRAATLPGISRGLVQAGPT